MSAASDEFPRSLVSAKLQGVALRTPPPLDTYVLECFTWALDQEGALGQRQQRIVRVAHSATVLQVLHSLGLITEAVVATPGAAKCLSTTSGGIRTQMFVVRAAAGDGSPHASLPEADLCSAAPLRNAINLRFPFAIAIVPVLRDPDTQQWGIPEWTAALTKLHRQNLVAENRAHDETATDPSPTTVAALLRSSDSLHRAEARHATSVRPAPLLPLPVLERPDAMIVISQAQLLTSSSLGPASSRPLGQPFDSGLFASGSQSRPDVLLSSAYSTSTTPRTPNRRRASSVSVQDDDAAAAAPAPATTTSSSLYQSASAEASRVPSVLTRKERRAAAEAERARLAELQAVRERNIAAIESQRTSKDAEMRHHVAQREALRTAEVEELRKQATFRLEKMSSRDKLTLQSKRDLLERHAAREMETKVEMLRLIESTREQLFPSVSTRDSTSEPFLPLSMEVMDSVSTEQRTSATLTSQRLSIITGGGGREHRSKSRALSVVELPSGEETELARLEKEQGKTSFVNRVAAARKATERRMSKFSTVKYHPFAVHAELQSLMHSLDAASHEFVHNEEAAREVERAAERERNTAEYHQRVMTDNIAHRVQLKMERKRSQLEHHAKQIAFEKVKKDEQVAAQQAADNAAKQRILKFYDRKRQQEEDAAQMAERERALESYVEHQKQMLESLVAAQSA